MTQNRIDALNSILDDLDTFEIELNIYYDDLEPQGVIDNVLSGMINSLRAFCQLLGWSELVTHMQNMTPLRGNAVESLASIKAFVIPEARKLLASSYIENPPSPTQ